VRKRPTNLGLRPAAARGNSIKALALLLFRRWQPQAGPRICPLQSRQTCSPIGEGSDEAIAQSSPKRSRIRPDYAEGTQTILGTVSPGPKTNLDQATPVLIQARASVIAALRRDLPTTSGPRLPRDGQIRRKRGPMPTNRALALAPEPRRSATLSRATLPLYWPVVFEARGWPEYEWRLRTKGTVSSRASFQPLLGTGRTLKWPNDSTACGNRGWGDAIQFIRYAFPPSKLSADQLIVGCSKSRCSIYSPTCPGIGPLSRAKANEPFRLLTHMLRS